MITRSPDARGMLMAMFERRRYVRNEALALGWGQVYSPSNQLAGVVMREFIKLCIEHLRGKEKP